MRRINVFIQRQKWILSQAIGWLLIPLAVCQADEAPSDSGPLTPPFVASDWHEIKETRTCGVRSCPGDKGFTVSKAGNFVVGSDLRPPIRTGVLSREDVVLLESVAKEVASEELGDQLTCVARRGFSGVMTQQLNITLNDQTTHMVYWYDASRTRVCYLGDLTRAENLFRVMDSLMIKYYSALTPSRP